MNLGTRGLHLLAETLKEKNIPLTILGYGTIWRGFHQRVRRLHDYLLRLPVDRIVVYSDADDVAFAPGCSKQDLLNQFLSFNNGKHVVLSAESPCFPDYSLYPKFVDPGSIGLRPTMYK